MKSIYLYLTLGWISALLISCAEVKRQPEVTENVRYNSFYPAAASKSSSPSSLRNKKDRHGYPTYSYKDKRRYVRTTAYSDAENEKGAYKNYNASGSRLKYGKIRSAAADWSVYPLGTTFKIKGLPYTYVVDDYGSALVGTNTIDIYHPKLSLMRKWGTRSAEIQIIKMGDWERSEKLLKGRRGYRHCNKMYQGVIKQMKRLGLR